MSTILDWWIQYVLTMEIFHSQNNKKQESNCNVCETSVSSGGSSAASRDATNLINHLRKFHVKDHQEFLLAISHKDTKQKTTGETLQDMHIAEARHVP